MDTPTTPICQNERCSHYMLRVSLAEMYANRCGSCKQPLNEQPAAPRPKPTARVRREGRQLRLRFAGQPNWIM